MFLAPANNYHTKKWSKWFSNHGHEVHVISFIDDSIDNVKVHYIDTGVSTDSSDSKDKIFIESKTSKKNCGYNLPGCCECSLRN